MMAAADPHLIVEQTPRSRSMEPDPRKLSRGSSKSGTSGDSNKPASKSHRKHSPTIRSAKERGRKILAKAKQYIDFVPGDSDESDSDAEKSSKHLKTSSDSLDDQTPSVRSSIPSHAGGFTKHHTLSHQQAPIYGYRHSGPVQPSTRFHYMDPGARKRTASQNIVLHRGSGDYMPMLSDLELLRRGGRASLLSAEYNERLQRIFRHKRKLSLCADERSRIDKENGKLKKNMFVLSLSLLFVATSAEGIQNLQTSVNSEGHLGSISLAMMYLGLFSSCLFLPPYFLNRVGTKATLAISIFVCSIYMLVNFSPTWYSLIPASIFWGIFTAPLNAAKDSYLTEIGIRYAAINFEVPSEVVNRFFGYFFAIFHLGRVIGNLISSKILHLIINPEIEQKDRLEHTCGHHYHPNVTLSPEAEINLTRPPNRAIYSVCSIYFACTLVALLIIGAFLNQLRKDQNLSLKKPSYRLEIWWETVQHLKRAKHIFLIPLTMFNGMEKAFLAGLYTKAYVACCLGIPNIGYVMVCYGCCSSLCSVLFGPLFELFGRMPLFMFGAVVDMLMIFTLLIWPPNPGDEVLFYVVAASWGMADGVWNTQISGLYADLFSQNLGTAFANHRLFESLGFIVTFLYIPYVSTEAALYSLLVFLLAGMCGYGLIEIWDCTEPSKEKMKTAVKNHPGMKKIREIKESRLFSELPGKKPAIQAITKMQTFVR